MGDFHPYKIFLKSYGGFPAFIGSPYLLIAGIISTLHTDLWLPNAENSIVWPAYAFQIIPSLLSFSIGGFAIFLSLTHPRIIDLAKEDGNDDSLFMQIASAFYTFIVFQTITIFLALVTTSTILIDINHIRIPASFISFVIFCYSLISITSIAATLLQLALLINREKSE